MRGAARLRERPLPIRSMNKLKELLLSHVCMAVCALSLILVWTDVLHALRAGPGAAVSSLEATLFMLAVGALVYSTCVYLAARCGWIRREAARIDQPLETLEPRYYAARASVPRVCVLVPSYKEEPGVLRQTILSAALSEYPARRIAVLIDDPPGVLGAEREALERTRGLIRELRHHFHLATARYHAAYSRFKVRANAGAFDLDTERAGLADLYDDLARWTLNLVALRAVGVDAANHTERFFVRSVIGKAAKAHRSRAAMLRAYLFNAVELNAEFRRLISLVKVDISSFERKQYSNLSHAPNKAMNLNSYIGLMGRSFRTVADGKRRRLEECPSSMADLIVPDADYILMLDADSMILRDYTMKMVDIMRRDRGLAVAQTPYGAIPGATSALERAAGAQTDVQCIVHQGATDKNATFWIGTNALLRLSALRDIQSTVVERGEQIPVFIPDRTVIEDFDATVGLVRRGWTLYNHPERLSYSATPRDFGSLVVQRRRWANGGLIIFPDLLRYAFDRRGSGPSTAELLFRAHFLCGPAMTSVSVLLLLMAPFDHRLMSPWLFATAVAYYAMYARDARRLGYSWRELVHVYTLGLMLLPVMLAGVLQSVRQLVTGRKSAFTRTPKVAQRTPVEPAHVLLQILLIAGMTLAAGGLVVEHRYALAVLAGANAALLVMGVHWFIGVRKAVRDLGAHTGLVRLVPPSRLAGPRLTRTIGAPAELPQQAENARSAGSR
jgi:cellulose synthase/poly-beta-1,6-N-acetylglucosamine synthase-like glycosyltransferase